MPTYYIEGTNHPRPFSNRTIYVDGSADIHYREGIDIELSHWQPNRTPERFKAGTSTEICFNFIQSSPPLSYDLVVNNHLDMDGLLSVFVLTDPDMALKHQKVLCEAAATGDFWAWSEAKALQLYQEVSEFFDVVRRPSMDKQDRYTHCINLVLKTLKDSESQTDASRILEHQYSLITEGEIQRTILHDRFVCYFVSKVTEKLENYLEIAPFNEPISDRIAFWPQVRNRLDQEKIQLIAIESEQGIYYDLWYPGYSWADTKGLWCPPGLIHDQDEQGCLHLHWPALTRITQRLNELEKGQCLWQLFSSVDFNNTKNPRNFPVVLSTLNKRKQSEASLLNVEMVSEIFKQEIDQDHSCLESVPH
jgi:hypothetical protein